MPARPSSRDRSRVRPLAALLFCGVVLLIVGPNRPPSLPRCDSAAVSTRLAGRLDEIPAFAGREARLIGIDEARRRGHAGTRPLRACQGRLMTSAGNGALEYSIRADAQRGFSVHPELFQGGWRARLLLPAGTPPRRTAASEAAGKTAGPVVAPLPSAAVPEARGLSLEQPPLSKEG